jgi:phospholipid transport system substrate-binding protein
MRTHFTRSLLTAVPALLLAASPCALAAPSGPTAVITELNATFLEVTKNATTLGYAGRREKVAPAIDRAFDVPFMAEKVLGKHWAKLSDAERARWVGLFRDFLTANYAGRLNRFSDQTFEILGEEPSAVDTVMVRGRVIDPGGENVDLDYRLHQTPAGWRIVDVYLKGTVSELALRRSDYTAVIERDGFEALATYLKEKMASLEAGKADSPTPAPE